MVYIASMQKTILVSFGAGVVQLLLLVSVAQAFTYTNGNLMSTPHEQPVYFTGDQTNGFWGYTESGRTFTQTPIENDLGFRIHKFAIDDAFFYITDRGIINAPNDLTALSMYFTISV